MLAMLTIAPKTDVAATAPYFLREMIYVILYSSLPIAIVVTLVGSLVGFLTVGPTFAVEVFKPDIKKFNIVKNLQQKFKMKTVIELIKSTLKIFGAAFLIYLIIKEHIQDIIITLSVPVIVSAYVFRVILLKIALVVGVYFVIIALADLIYQRLNFAKEMKMEKFEVKQEYKDTEGNPEIKSKRRQIAQEIAYDDGGVAQVKRAKTIVTNPEDIAAAIGDEPDKYKHSGEHREVNGRWEIERDHQNHNRCR